MVGRLCGGGQVQGALRALHALASHTRKRHVLINALSTLLHQMRPSTWWFEGSERLLTNARYVRPGSTYTVTTFLVAPSTPHHPCHPRLAGRSPARSSSKVPRKASKSPARGENQRAAQAFTCCIATQQAPVAPKSLLDAILASCSNPLTRTRTRDARTNTCILATAARSKSPGRMSEIDRLAFGSPGRKAITATDASPRYANHIAFVSDFCIGIRYCSDWY
jgi:hypothetical protein